MQLKQFFLRFRGRVGQSVVLVLGMSLCAGMAGAQAAASGNLDKVLTQLDGSAAKFHSAKADFQWDQFERVVSSTDTQTGVIYYSGSGDNTKVALDIMTLNAQPAKKQVVFSGGVLQFYQPQIDQMTVIHAGAKQEQYLALGFGGSGTELKKSWNITLLGMETIDGVQTAKLDLVSKDAGVRANFTHFTIWVDPARAVSLKQIWYETSGDMRTSYFRNIQYNQKVAPSVFKIKTDAKTQVVQK